MTDHPDRIWTWPYGGGISGDYRTTPRRPLDPAQGPVGAEFLRATPVREAAPDLYDVLRRMLAETELTYPLALPDLQAEARAAMRKARGQA